MATLRPLPLVALASALLFSAVLPAQQAAPAARIVNPIDENQLVTLKGNVNPQAIAKNDKGRVSDSLPMAGLVLVLSRTPEQQAAFDAYVQSEYDSGSPNFHHWLTPDQVGQLYGPAQQDIRTLTGWLASKGFAVTGASKDRMTISFSGSAGQVSSAFHTQIHQLSVNGKPHIANMTDPQVPAALATVVFGIKGLHNFLPHPLHRMGSKVQFNPDAQGWVRTQASSRTKFTPGALKARAPANSASSPKPRFYSANGSFGVEEDVTPADFAKIYNLPSGWPTSNNGSGQTITIIGTSDIDTTDVASFKTAFGLPAGLPLVLAHNPTDGDPGNCGTTPTNFCNDGDLEENSLDVEWSGAVAPGAQIVLVTDAYNSTTNPTNDPIFDGAQWAIDNAAVSGSAVFGSHIVSVSYGECELYSGTASNVAYNNLWQTAASTGISVFVATGDSGSPACDDGYDADGVPYEAQYGLSVSGLASSPYNTAVGGTDFSWCQPTVDTSNGDINGCASSNASTYWNTSNNSTTQASAKGYVPETPWNDTCENPLNAPYIEGVATILGGGPVSTPEEACNFIYQNSQTLLDYYEEEGTDPLIEYVDTIGGSGGASSCVVNNTDTDPNAPACTSGATTTGSTYGNLTLVNNGWPSPSWQANSGVTGTSGLTQRAIPDISFFAGDGGLDSATLICVSNDGASCTDISETDTSNDGGAEGVGGTSVATPEMAGVMALINQKEGAAQGSPNVELYGLAKKQNYSECSASGSPSGNCYFNDIDTGTNAMACVAEAGTAEGGAVYEDGGFVESEQYLGSISPNCSVLNPGAGDTVGTLSGYSGTVGYDEASGLGSLNVANVVNGWTSDAGTKTATMAVVTTPAASAGTITLGSNVSLVIAVTLTGADGTPTGTITVTGGGYDSTQTLASGAATITIPPGSLAPGTDTLSVTYSGDATYASASQTLTVDASAAVATVTVSAPPKGNVANPVSVTVGVTGPGPIPTGTVSLTAGTYGPTPAETLNSSGTYSFTIPAGDLPVGNSDLITANYSGDSHYGSATGTTTIKIVSTALLTPTITATVTPTSIDTSGSLSLAISVSGTGGLASGAVTVTSTAASTGSTLAAGITAQLSGGVATIPIPANSLNAGTDTLSVAYAGDSVYAAGTGSASVTVTQATYSLSAAAASPASVSPGTSATSAITGGTSTTGYVGVVTLSSCSITTSPTNAVNLPTCSVSGTITYTGGSTDTPTGTGTATVATYSNSSAMNNTHPFKLIYGAGGTALAFLVFLGIPARRKSWRVLLGAIVLLAGLGTLSACGGGGGGTTTSTATSPGAYTFTVTGTGNDPATTQESATFNLTVN